MGTLLRVYVSCCRGNLLIAVVRFVGLYIIVTYLGCRANLYSSPIPTYIGQRVNHYWSAYEPILVATWTYIGRLSDQYRSSRLQNQRRSSDVRKERGAG